MTDGQQSVGRDDHSGGGPAIADPSVLRLSPSERDERGIDDEEVREAFVDVLRHGDAEQKDLRGVTLPAIDLDRRTVEGENRHPVDLRDASIESLSAAFAAVRLPIRLDGATIGDLTLDESHVEEAIYAPDLTVTGDVSAFETTFHGDVECEGAVFEGEVNFDEAVFENDVSFDEARFEGAVRARAAEFYGDSNLLGDNTSFTGAAFAGTADFRQAEFGFTHFEAVSFEEGATFREATVDGDADFDGAVFRGLADFDEGRFEGDTSFAGAAFHGPARFRGVAFSGDTRALEDDVTFARSTFHDEADFDHAQFRYVAFAGATFEGRAGFEETAFTADADFPDVGFEAAANFDEARFEQDADFSGTRFDDRCVFRGVEFQGGANYLEDDATFEGARFADDVDFHDAEITSANFEDVAFGGVIDFSDTVFSDRIDFRATEVDDDAFVDFTRTKVRSGRITQPDENWVRFDMTLASVGDVELAAATDEDYRRILDYVRFCRTEFDEFDGHTFDFGVHREYLDRNAWALHEFHEPPGLTPEYELEMTPEVIEETYLRAKQAAVADGEMKVAGEFRVKRQQFSRRKNLEVVRDSSTDLWTRAKNLGRATENYFLGVTCGHGMRPIRIALVFAITPMLFVLPYTFGGPAFETSAGQLSSVDRLFTPEGLSVFYENVHFSYISYTTIGYGNIGPQGALARLLAGTEAYLSTLFAALLVYALVKRSEL